MKCQRLSATILCLCTLALGGCNTEYGPIFDASAPSHTIIDGKSRDGEPLQAGNKLKITIYGEPALSGIYDISPTGFVTLPLAGRFKAEKLTPGKLEAAIAEGYKKFLNEPKITVEVAELRPFYIMGEVVSPGQFPYRGGLNLLTAISTAGGLTYRASKTAVFLQHPGEEGWHEVPLLSTVQIAPGDLIRVPERYF